MKEEIIQSKIVIDFSQKRPDLNGCLWSVPNRTLSLKDAMKQRSMGLIKGVSDLHLLFHGRFIGIEIKAPGKRHKKEHIQSQWNWGRTIIKNGGEWYIVTSVDGFWSAILTRGEQQGFYSHRQVTKMLLESKGTLVF